jgi:serine/threonine-protein kinase
MLDATAVRVGEVLAGKYRVERMLGAGGMGVVVAAEHMQLGQRVALKFLKLEAASEVSVKRFLREARAAAQIRGEHVARISDVGTLEDGSPYMVMELLEGRDLSAELAVRGALPVPHAIEYVLQACEAVAEAHVAGIVHRDLKPANLFLTHRPGGAPLVKVLDFGISKVITGSGDNLEPSLTGTSALLGSPRYMSPEQLRGSKNVDARTDVWALGVILYELFSGSIPFDAETLPGLLAQIAADPPTPITAVCSNLPEGLAAVVMRCLEKDITRRFANVGDLALALLPYGAPSSRHSVERILAIMGMPSASAFVAAPPPPPPTPTLVIPESVARAAIPPHTSTSFGQTGGEGKRVRGKRTPLGWLAIPMVLLAVGGAFFGLRGSRPETKSDLASARPQVLVPPAPPTPAKIEPSTPEPTPMASAVETARTAAAPASSQTEHGAEVEPSAPLTKSAHAAPSATSAPSEPRRAPTPVPKAPVRRPANPVKSAPLSNILDGRE